MPVTPDDARAHLTGGRAKSPESETANAATGACAVYQFPDCDVMLMLAGCSDCLPPPICEPTGRWTALDFSRRRRPFTGHAQY